ncbi:MAG: hypothetical protein AAGA85_16080 [Bacteroidota bacterium]
MDLSDLVLSPSDETNISSAASRKSLLESYFAIYYFTTMENYEIVEYILIGFAVFYLVFEIVLNLNDLDNDTSNIIILKWAQDKMFFLPFVFGAIGGHLFLGTKLELFRYFRENFIVPVIILFGIALIMLAIGYLVPFKKTKAFLFSLLILGFLYGHFFWTMNIVSNRWT